MAAALRSGAVLIGSVLPAARGAVERVAQPLVLLSGRRAALVEWPDALPELEHQHAVVLAGGPQRALLGVEVNLRRAPVGAARPPVVAKRMVRAGTQRGRPGRVVVGDLLRPAGVANVEHADARIEHAAGERRCVLLV